MKTELLNVRKCTPLLVFVSICLVGIVWSDLANSSVVTIFLLALSVSSLVRTKLVHKHDQENRFSYLKHIAYHDELTGLYNRRKFIEQLNDKIAQHCDSWVLLIDLDGFKRVNDVYGHDSGDIVLQQVAARLSNCINKNSVLARIGGDEFAIVTDGTADEITTLSRKIKRHVAKSITVGGKAMFVGASIGFSRMDANTLIPVDVLRKADKKMYDDKLKRKSCKAEFLQPPILHVEPDNDVVERAPNPKYMPVSQSLLTVEQALPQKLLWPREC